MSYVIEIEKIITSYFITHQDKIEVFFDKLSFYKNEIEKKFLNIGKIVNVTFNEDSLIDISLFSRYFDVDLEKEVVHFKKYKRKNIHLLIEHNLAYEYLKIFKLINRKEKIKKIFDKIK